MNRYQSRFPEEQPVNWWQTLIGNVLFSRPYKSPERMDILDPFNFLMDQYLHFNQGDTAPLLARTAQRFPALGHQQAQHVLEEVAQAYRYAMARQYEARDGKMSPEQADQDVRARFQQLDEANLRALLAQTLTGAYR